MSFNNTSDNQQSTEQGRHNKQRFMPLYNDKGDYNTNAASYYDFLARPNYYWKLIGQMINRLLRRDIVVEETPTITINKKTSWQEPNQDNTTLSADLHISKAVEHDNDLNIDLPNGIGTRDDGVYTADYRPAVKRNRDDIVDLQGRAKALEDRMGVVEGDVTKLKTDFVFMRQEVDIINEHIKTIEGIQQSHDRVLKEIVRNLQGSGAWYGDFNSGNFNGGRYIATGNINIYSGEHTNNNAIRTHNEPQENDIKAGR